MVDYEGKEAIGKVTVEEEARAYERVLRGWKPPEVARHFPVMYKVIRDNATGVCILVMERLIKASGQGMIFEDAEYQDGEHTYYLQQKAVEVMAEEVARGEVEGLVKIITREIHDEDEARALVLATDDWGKALAILAESFKETYSRQSPRQNTSRQEAKRLIKGALRRFGWAADQVISDIMRRRHFPMDNGEMRQWMVEEEDELEGVESLKRALLWVREHEGIAWGDLHNGNVMQRPDGTLVVSDLGLFG